MTLAATMPRWMKLTAPALGLWYAFGLSQMISGYLADPSAVPALIWLAYAAACLLGMAGSAALVFAPKRATGIFAASLASAIAFFGYTFSLTAPTGEEIGIGTVVMLITAGLMLLSRRLR